MLFMIDNTEEIYQEWLIQYAPHLFAGLDPNGGGLDLHVGIITSTLGAGAFTPPSCETIGGEHGKLQNTLGDPTHCSLSQLVDPEARFLTYAATGGGDVTTNVTGDFAEAFSCYAKVGTGGCAFEHQLASVRAALDGCNTEAGCVQTANAGFLRPDAQLAAILITDEDDCSAPPDSTLFDPSQTTLDSQLGPLTSYRCFEFGILCGGADVGRTGGTFTDCAPGNKDPDPLHQLTPVGEIADFLKALKPWPRSVYTAVIAGKPDPVVVGIDPNTGYPDLQPSCVGPIGTADPAIRLPAFVNQFDSDRGEFVSMCAPDINAAMDGVAAEIAAMLEDPCGP